MAIVLDDEDCKVGLGQGQRGISRAAFPDRVKVWYLLTCYVFQGRRRYFRTPSLENIYASSAQLEQARPMRIVQESGHL